MMEGEGERVIVAAVVPGSRHGDGFIYSSEASLLGRLYHLDDTREFHQPTIPFARIARLKPMRFTDPTPDCLPCFTACTTHLGCDMLQIFSLKLTKLPAAAAAAAAAGPIQLYGFMAVRDLLDPLRNYVFNHSRDEPYIIRDLHSDPFIYLSGPKRGIYLECRVLIEFHMMIKMREREEDDLPLIDGGDRGAAVDISRALLSVAVEATVDVWITKLGEPLANGDGGLDLSIIGSLPQMKHHIKVFRGIIDKPRAVGRFVVAVNRNSYLFLRVVANGRGPPKQFDWFAFRATGHGCIDDRRELDFATVEVKVTWSSLY
ncbi:hypothetical protein ACP4OV_023074 [Aristida adscensionis]